MPSDLDMVSVPREMLARFLEKATVGVSRLDGDFATLEVCLKSTVTHDYQKCPICIHEYATSIPPLVKVGYDPLRQQLYAWIDNGPDQGPRATAIIEGAFARDPFAVELAGRISRALAPLRHEKTSAYIAALAGAFIRIVDRMPVCEDEHCDAPGHQHNRKDPME